MKRKIKLELKENRNYVYMSMLITILTMLPQLYFSPFLLHTLFLIVATIWLFSISKFSKTLFSILVIFINITNMIIGHVAMHWGYYKADLSPRIETVMISPQYEQLEYLKSFIDYRDVVLVIYTIVVLGLLFKYFIHFKHDFKTLKRIGITVFVVLTISFSPYHDHVEKLEPFSLISKYFKIQKNSIDKESILKRKAFLQSEDIAKNNDVNGMYDKVILILGESANKRHMGVYGYEVETTPYLSSLYKENKLTRLNAISPTNQTAYSIPILLTKAHVSDFENAYEHSHSIITDFKAQGYDSYWISNQGKRGDSKIVTIADEADKQYFANQGYYTEAKTDQAVLDILETMTLDHKKEFYIIHLMGSHGAYTNEHVLYKSTKNIVQEYDNTIYFTDYVIEYIIKHFDHEKVLLLYISDHGEVLNKTKNGHGFVPAYQDEYEVPFLIYSTVENRKIENLVDINARATINLEHFNEMIKYISGISDENKTSYSSRVFTVHPENVVDFYELDFLGSK